MSNDLETRLLIPFFEHLKTDPVIVNYKIFSRTCAEIIFFLSFLLINLCVIRGFFFTLWHTSDINTKFYDRLKQVLQDQIDDNDDNNEEDESNQLDENENELEAATSPTVDEINETDVRNVTISEDSQLEIGSGPALL